MGLRYGVLLLPVLLVAGCTADTVTLRDQKTGQEATCGGEIVLPARPPSTQRCAKLMEEAGYEKLGE